MKYTKTRKQIPSIKLSKQLLQELCEMLENEHKKFNQDDKHGIYKVKYSFSDKDVTVIEKTMQSFLDNVPISQGTFTLEFESKYKDIQIDMQNTHSYDRNSFSVSGDDSTWVFGITQQLEKIFTKHKTINHIFYTKKSWPIFIMCTVALFFIVSASLAPFINEEDSNFQGILYISVDENGEEKLHIAKSYFVALVTTPHATYFLWPSVFRRAFPLMEMENTSLSKIKNLFLYAILAIVSSIIAGSFFYLIKPN